MSKQQISNLIVGSLFLFSCGTLVARQPGSHNPCKVLETDLDSQVNSLHRRQNVELAQCRQANGKNSATCRDLKGQQEVELNRRRSDRHAQLSNCNSQGAVALDANGLSESHHYQNSETDCSPGNEYPRHPDKPYKPKKPHDPQGR